MTFFFHASYIRSYVFIYFSLWSLNCLSIIHHLEATSCIYKRKNIPWITKSLRIFPWSADSESFLGTNLVQTVFSKVRPAVVRPSGSTSSFRCLKLYRFKNLRLTSWKEAKIEFSEIFIHMYKSPNPAEWYFKIWFLILRTKCCGCILIKD